MAHPLLYEINTRCWLSDLARSEGRPVTLADIPASCFGEWRQHGFTHIWLMGVWQGGPRAREQALAHPAQIAEYRRALPDLREADIGPSPYAIASYAVPTELGGEPGLRSFRESLARHGLKLVLDFVPNHLGLDHPWLASRPQLFVQSRGPHPDTFAQETSGGVRWLAHGKDPNFPGWSDTAQLDYRLAETRDAMAGLLESVAERCDGVRCDMAMLVLSEVFDRTWRHLPAGGPATAGEFWGEAIDRVRRRFPDFLFVAEAYWGLEPRLQALGFDYTYDKGLYDRLLQRNAASARDHIFGLAPSMIEKSVHFLENHDERRIATLLSPAEHRAAALLILALPGMRFLHEGQLSGWTVRTPVQLLRRAAEPQNPEIAALYRQLLRALALSPVGRGRWGLVQPFREGSSEAAREVVAVRWEAGEARDLALVNLGDREIRVVLPGIDGERPPKREIRDRLTGVVLPGTEGAGGLRLTAAPHAAWLLQLGKA